MVTTSAVLCACARDLKYGSYACVVSTLSTEAISANPFLSFFDLQHGLDLSQLST